MSAKKGTTGDSVLQAIARFHDERGFAPTVREISDMTGLASTSTVHYWLTKLREEGHIDWLEGGNRTVHVLERSKP